MISDFRLESNRFYWFKHCGVNNWQVCYVAEDYDGDEWAQWFHLIGTASINTAKIDLDKFDFVNLEPPPSEKQSLGDMLAGLDKSFVDEQIKRVNARYTEKRCKIR